MRRLRQQDLFEDKSPYHYHAIASNRANEDAAATMEWYSKRGDASENRIKDLKIGFGLDYMPCGSVHANAVFFAIGVLAYNMYLGFRRRALGSGWERSLVQGVAVVSDGGQDRPPWPAAGLEDQCCDDRCVHGDPRALHPHHPGRRRHSRNVLTPAA
ncbi:MAG: hypothetical protein ACRECV_04410 [Xanthobacteraceae bacterium]